MSPRLAGMGTPLERSDTRAGTAPGDDRAMDTRIELIACCLTALGLFTVIGVEPALLLPPAAAALVVGAWSRFRAPHGGLSP